MAGGLDRDMLRNAVAIPIDGSAVMVTMRRGERGPWSVVTDLPTPGHEMVGPPPGYLALVGVSSCTIVTVAGVASRGDSELLGMRVAFDVDATADGTYAIRQRTTFEGDLSERDLLRLSRAVGHCPVGKNFTKRGLAIEDAVTLVGAHGPDGGPDVAALPDALDLDVFAPGRIEADYLTDTREWLDVDGRRVLDQEGEVTAHVDCARPGAGGQRWAYMGGHSSAGWAPRPSSYAQAALAASTLMVLRSLAAELRVDPASLRVEVTALSSRPTGGKTASQAAAAEGVAQRVTWRRAVTVAATSPTTSRAAIERAMRRDPIYGICMRGDLLVGDEIAVVPPSTADTADVSVLSRR